MSTPIIPAWWPTTPKPGNFGDILTPYFITKITEKRPKYVNRDFSVYDMNLLAVGSIVKMATANTVVWGSGVISSKDVISSKADFRAVRGPITRKMVLEQGGSCPEIYGDPALLLPRFYSPNSKKKYKIGIIPHYVDYDLVTDWYADVPDIKIINLLTDNIEKTIDEIYECENVVSSSLHGIITAHAYGLKAVWVEFSDKLFGDGIKFRDYFASVSIEMDRITVNQKLSKHELEALPFIGDIQFDGAPLLEAFPHNSFNYRT